MKPNLAARWMMLALPLLLAACGSTGSPATPTPTPPTPTTPTPTSPNDDVPTVPRMTRSGSTAPCVLTQSNPGSLAELRQLRDVTVLPPKLGEQAIANPGVYDLLYATRKTVNENYWGTSTVDLQALHEDAETNFRKTFGNLKEAALTTSVDTEMRSYIGKINDGHTYYLNAAQYKAVRDAQNGNSTPTPRFGFQWNPVPGEDGAVLLDVAPGSPAASAGLIRGDTILRVNGQALLRTGDDDATFTAMQSILSAAARTGQNVQLVVRRGTQILNVTVKPALISSNESPSGRMLNPTTYLLRIPSFDATITGSGASTVYTSITAQQTHDLIRQAQSQGATKLVIDMRDNGGGYLLEAVGVAAAISPALAGMTLEELDPDNDVTFAYLGGYILAGTDCFPISPIASIDNPATWTGQTVVLVNGSSASAAEVVPQIMQLGGAKVYGESTYGIGNTTTVIQGLVGGRGMGVTSSLSRNLRGDKFQANTTPNVAVTDDLRALAHGTDAVLQAALASLQ